MIAYSIEAAQKSNLFERILVSTDDEEISEISKTLGAQVPFKRPPELSDDYTPTVPVIAHAIRELHKIGLEPNKVCSIYPCVPFIQVTDLIDSLILLEKSNAKFSFPITEYPSSFQRALKRNEEGLVSAFYPEFELTRTQDLEMAYFDAGQFYWGAADS